MKDLGKRNVLGVLVDAVDYDAAVARVLEAAVDRKPYAVSALAVHGVMTGVQDPAQAYRLNNLDMVTPDGQPVRWALNWLHGAELSDRVYGPQLTIRVCRAATERELPIFFYGSTARTLAQLQERLPTVVPGIRIAGTEPSKFRRTTTDEKNEIVDRIRTSGAAITFVGLGCPRQEVFVFEYREALSMPVLAVGAAFDYHAGTLVEPPAWMQRAGLQWLFRLAEEPGRLWKRYTVANARYVGLLVAQKLGLRTLDPGATTKPAADLFYG